jgi:hypothetical protein
VVRYKAALRKSIQRNKGIRSRPEYHRDADLMTIILVFMLKSMAASSASIPQSGSEPAGLGHGRDAQEGVVVVIRSRRSSWATIKPDILLPSRERSRSRG